MKIVRRHRVTAILALLFVTMLTLTNFEQPAASTLATATPLMPTQTVIATAADPASEIGSTSGILLMGIVIALIVTLPLFLRKKRR
jgi:predicted ferric reductase